MIEDNEHWFRTLPRDDRYPSARFVKGTYLGSSGSNRWFFEIEKRTAIWVPPEAVVCREPNLGWWISETWLRTQLGLKDSPAPANR